MQLTIRKTANRTMQFKRNRQPIKGSSVMSSQDSEHHCDSALTALVGSASERENKKLDCYS